MAVIPRTLTLVLLLLRSLTMLPGVSAAPLTGDLVQFVKLVETLQHLDAQSTAFYCQDVPPQMGDLYRLYVANYMKKPIVTGAFTRAGWNVMWELLSVVAGSGERLEERPLAIFDSCPSPRSCGVN